MELNYKKSKMSLALKIVGAVVGILGLIVAFAMFFKNPGLADLLDKAVTIIFIAYGFIVLLTTAITCSILFGLAVVIDNQAKIKAKLDYQIELQNKNNKENISDNSESVNKIISKVNDNKIA